MSDPDLVIINTTDSITVNSQGSFVLSSTVVDAALFPGATVGEQIAAAIGSLPTTGGVVDARNLPSAGTWPAMTIPQSGYKLMLPPGYINVTGTIQLYDVSGVQGVNWEGVGDEFPLGGTQFIWAGNTSDPMFRLRGVRDSGFKDFSIQGNSGAPLAEAIRLETATGTTSSRRVFKNIIINGVAAHVAKGFRWCIGNDVSGGAGPDVNNDVDYLENVEVAAYSNTAFSIEGTESVSHVFVNCVFEAFLAGQRGVATTQAANSSRNSGSFRWYGGTGGGNLTADFDLGKPNSTILISGAALESSNRMLQTASVNDAAWPITIEGCRWAADNLNADNHVVIYKSAGPLVLVGNYV